MRSLLPVFAIGFLACSGCAVKHQAPKEFSCTEGKFRVLMPGEPRWSVKYASFVPIHIAEAVNPEIEYAVGYGEFIGSAPKSSDLPRVYAAMKTAVLAECKGTLLYEFGCSVDGFSGQEFGFSLPGEKKLISKMRSVAVGNKLYMYGVVGTKITANSPEARQFFDSFKLVEKPTGAVAMK